MHQGSVPLWLFVVICLVLGGYFRVVPSIVVSVAYISAFVIAGELVRKRIKKSAQLRRKKKLKIVAAALEELVATWEMCTVSFELIIVADNYGLFVYSLFLFALCTWWCYFLEDSSACTYVPLEDWVDGEIRFNETLVRIAAQLVGGLLSFPLIFVLWYIEAAETHVGRAVIGSGECRADLEVSVLAGMLIEGGLTLLYRLACRYFYDGMSRGVASAMDALVTTVFVAIAFPLSGGYFNPVEAATLMWGCSLGLREHLLVYWLASSAGAVAAVKLYRLHHPAKQLDLSRP